MKKTMTKDTIPEGFTVPMALVDALPVLFFAGTGILLGMIVKSLFVEVCAAVMFLSGALKVIWKLIAAVQKKNIWPLFVQMRIAMPLGLLGVIAGLLFAAFTGAGPFSGVVRAVFHLPQGLFFLAGFVGMGLMIWCAKKLDSSDPKSNWIEQGINSAAQGCIFLGLLMVYLGK